MKGKRGGDTEISTDGTLSARNFEYELNLQIAVRMVLSAGDDQTFNEGVKRLSIIMEPYKDKEYKAKMEDIKEKYERTMAQARGGKVEAPTEAVLIANKFTSEDIFSELMRLQYRVGMLPKQDVSHTS